MSRTFSLFMHMAALIVLFSLGCQNNPASPNAGIQPDLSIKQTAAESPVHQCLGFYSVAIDTGNLSIEFLPLRTGEWHFNLTGILNTMMGVSAVSVPGEADPANGLFVFDITLTHPFDDKPNFCGFDVKGVLMAPGTLGVGDLVFSDADETQLENADGYTRWWNPTEFTSPGIFGYTEGTLAIGSMSSLTATVNPYKLFADILGPDDPLVLVSNEPLNNPQGRAVFINGSSNTRRYRIRFPMDPGPLVVFGYAIDCAWNPPVPNPPNEIPDDFPINANQPEAFRIPLGVLANTLYYDSESGMGGGVLRLGINAHDWQGQDAGNVSSDISGVWISAPDLMPGEVACDFINETPAKARYSVDLTGAAVPTEAGEALIICRVGSSDGSTYQQAAAPGPVDPLSAFQVLTLDIPDPECSGDANNDWLEAVEIGFGDQIIDQVCLPDDYRDFYYFEIDPGYEATGDISLWCDAEPTKLGLYDDFYALIEEVDVSGGEAAIGLQNLDLMPGKYFIRVLTSNNTQTSPYLLEFTGELSNVIPSDPVEVTPSDLYVNPTRVWLHDDYAVLTGRGIWVYNISDPTDPVQVYTERIFIGELACFNYPYLYYMKEISPGETEISMVDFTDITNPVHHENLFVIMHTLRSITMNSTHLYVGTYLNPTSEIYIFDISTDPMSPVQVGVFNVAFSSSCLKLIDPEGPDTRIVVGVLSKIRVYDVEDPSSVNPIGFYTYPVGFATDITIRGDYIYAASTTGSGDGFLQILYSATGSVFDVGSVEVPGDAWYIDIEWPYVYIGDGVSGLTICEVTNPANPVYISSTPVIAKGRDLAVRDDLAYIIPDWCGLQIFDCSIPLTPSSLSRLKVVNSVYSFVKKDGWLITGSHQGIKTIDISDPSNAYVAAEYFPSYPGVELQLYGDVLATASFYTWGLHDAADPLNISPMYFKTEADFVYALGIYENAIYVYLSQVGCPVKIYDITNPYAPGYEMTMSFTDPVRDFTFLGDYMYVASGAAIEVYSIVNPFSPAYVGSYFTPGNPGYTDSVIYGNYLYALTDDSIEIAHLADPAVPVNLGSELLPPPTMGGYNILTVEGQFGYAAGYTADSVSFWVWPPDSPTNLGLIYDDYYHSPRDLLAFDDYLYEASEYTGLFIYDLY